MTTTAPPTRAGAHRRAAPAEDPRPRGLAGRTSALAAASARRPWRVVGAWALVLVGALAAVVLLLGPALSATFGVTTETESSRGADLLAERLPDADPASEVVVVRSEAGVGVTDPGVVAAAGDLAASLRDDPAVVDVPDPATAPLPVSDDGQALLLPVTLTPEAVEDGDVEGLLAAVEAADASPAVSAAAVGDAVVNADFVELSESDLRDGELFFGLPAAMVVLLLVFGAVVAASVPLLLAVMSIVVSTGVVALVGQVFPMSFFVTNMVVAMGLALGIDYALFVLSRFREERRHGRDVPSAISVAGATSSASVLFSGSAFVLALLGLLLVPDVVLRSLAAGAVITGVVTVAAALTLLPAVLSLLGPRVERGRLPLVGRLSERDTGRMWSAVAHGTMRRPALVLTACVVLLLLAASPLLRLETGTAGVSTLPPEVASAQGFAALEESFPGGGTADPARVVVAGDLGDPAVASGVDALVAAASGDARFGPVTSERDAAAGVAVVDVALPGDPNGGAAKSSLAALRDDVVPPALAGSGAEVAVTGATAEDVDTTEVLSTWLPRVIAFVLATAFLLLTVVFRSVVLAGKAVALNLLSVGAAYGLIVLVFVDGVGADLLGLTRVDTVESWVPVFLFAVLFALSMDYHVFLLSRVRERWLATGDTRDAVAGGIASTGRLITGAALVIVVVFAGFATGDLVMFQQMGFGVGVALLLDATVVRGLVVPSSMALLGRWSWYLPSWLQWLPELSVEGPVAPAPRRQEAAVPVP